MSNILNRGYDFSTSNPIYEDDVEVERTPSGRSYVASADLDDNHSAMVYSFNPDILEVYGFSGIESDYFEPILVYSGHKEDIKRTDDNVYKLYSVLYNALSKKIEV